MGRRYEGSRVGRREECSGVRRRLIGKCRVTSSREQGLVSSSRGHRRGASSQVQRREASSKMKRRVSSSRGHKV